MELLSQAVPSALVALGATSLPTPSLGVRDSASLQLHSASAGYRRHWASCHLSVPPSGVRLRGAPAGTFPVSAPGCPSLSHWTRGALAPVWLLVSSKRRGQTYLGPALSLGNVSPFLPLPAVEGSPAPRFPRSPQGAFRPLPPLPGPEPAPTFPCRDGATRVPSPAGDPRELAPSPVLHGGPWPRSGHHCCVLTVTVT